MGVNKNKEGLCVCVWGGGGGGGGGLFLGIQGFLYRGIN